MSSSSTNMAVTNPSQYKISTITATGSINTEVNLDVLFQHIITISECEKEGVSYAEYGNLKKGVSKKNTHTRKVHETKKKFDNQLTLEYRITMLPHSAGYTVLNCKIFKNGNIQMTGVKFIEQGSIFIDRIINIVRGAPSEAANNDMMENQHYTVRMINCDYRIGFNIKRDALFRVMVSDFENMVSYEPCIYPGVKIQYMWNKRYHDKKGICHCKDTCINGKGKGNGEGECKKITVAVFQSGCVIITGAQNEVQINDTYAWVNDILSKNRERIEKWNVVLPENVASKKKVLIPKNKIVSLRSVSLAPSSSTPSYSLGYV